MRVVVINLQNETHRLERISALAGQIGFAIERIEGIDGRDPENRDLIEKHRKSSSFHPPVPDTDMACALSHRKAWRSLIDSEDRWLAVFEDDVHFGLDIASLFDEAWIPAGVELIKLETMLRRGSLGAKSLTAVGDRKLYRLGGSNLGTAGYLISRRAAAFLMRMTESMELPVDSIMFDRRGDLMRHIPVHQIVPAACIQEWILARHEGRADELPSAMVRPPLPPRGRWRRLLARNRRLVSRLWFFIGRKGPGWGPMGSEGPIPFV